MAYDDIKNAISKLIDLSQKEVEAYSEVDKRFEKRHPPNKLGVRYGTDIFEDEVTKDEAELMTPVLNETRVFLKSLDEKIPTIIVEAFLCGHEYDDYEDIGNWSLKNDVFEKKDYFSYPTKEKAIECLVDHIGGDERVRCLTAFLKLCDKEGI